MRSPLEVDLPGRRRARFVMALRSAKLSALAWEVTENAIESIDDFGFVSPIKQLLVKQYQKSIVLRDVSRHPVLERQIYAERVRAVRSAPVPATSSSRDKI